MEIPWGRGTHMCPAVCLGILRKATGRMRKFGNSRVGWGFTVVTVFAGRQSGTRCSLLRLSAAEQCSLQPLDICAHWRHPVEEVWNLRNLLSCMDNTSHHTVRRQLKSATGPGSAFPFVVSKWEMEMEMESDVWGFWKWNFHVPASDISGQQVAIVMAITEATRGSWTRVDPIIPKTTSPT